MIWGDFVGKYSQRDSVDACKKLGGILPQREDFERAEANGFFREVVPHGLNEEPFFWVSTANPDDGAYYYNGYMGVVDRDNLYLESGYKYSVRCGGR